MDTHPRVLVTYATAAGSTTGIAERIAETIRASGAEVTCRPAGPDLDPRAFDAFVVGSAVHDMAWLAPALEALPRLQETGRPVWCFSVGGIQPRGRINRAMTDRELRRVARAFPPSFVPRGQRMFGGIIDLEHTPLWGRLFFRAMGGRAGDHRDWAAVEGWAREVAAGLPERGDDAQRCQARTPTSPAAGTSPASTATASSPTDSGSVPSRSDRPGR
jgi:menaquinone-dependent protoporphyrinogen oxidase